MSAPIEHRLSAAGIKTLHTKIGELTLENDFLVLMITHIAPFEDRLKGAT